MFTDVRGTFTDVIKNKNPGQKLEYSVKYEKEGYINV